MMMKKLLSLALAALMLLSIGSTALAAPVRLSSADAQAQIALILSQFDKLKQDESSKPWSYAVTDLDRNGRLELLAASEHDSDRSTTLAAWEVDAGCTALLDSKVDIKADESFPDIVSVNADTFYDADADAWHYLFYDNIVLSEREAYAIKCSVNLHEGVISYRQYAHEYVVTDGDQQTVEFRDTAGGEITLEQYNAAGVNAFAGKDRSSTNIDWFSADDATLERLTDSFAVFAGEKEPGKSTRVPGSQSGVSFMTITKDPTNESHPEGDTAWFVSGADVWDYLTWTFVAPDGAEYSVTDFIKRFPDSRLGGTGGTVLSISNVTRAMDGYGVYCTFRYKGQTARTSTAWLYVQAAPAPVRTKVMSGKVTDALMSTVTIRLENGATVQPLWDICNVDGEFAIGCLCDVYYRGDTPNTGNLSYVYIYGNSPQPGYGSMDGYISDASMNYVTVDLGYGGSVYVSQQYVNLMRGELTVGSDCTVYYYGEYPTDDNVYAVDVYGSEPEPMYGSEDGYITDASMNYVSISLNDGSAVYVSQQYVNVIWGELTIGSGCTVFYLGEYPTDDNIYEVDVYGSEPVYEEEENPDTWDIPSEWFDPDTYVELSDDDLSDWGNEGENG